MVVMVLFMPILFRQSAKLLAVFSKGHVHYNRFSYRCKLVGELFACPELCMNHTLGHVTRQVERHLDGSYAATLL